jgi:glycosyltransferase involved in cell wall biosynthesis
MRVTHVVSGDLWAGAEVQCFQLLRSFAESGEVSPRAIVLNEGELAQRIRSLGIPLAVIPENQYSALELFRRLVDDLRTHRADLVHTHRTKENILGAMAARVAGVRASVRTAHGASEHRPRGLALAKRVAGTLDRFVGKHLQRRVVAVSSDLAQRLTPVFGAQRIRTIPNGIDVERTRAEAAALAELPGKAGVVRIGLVGRLVPVKRVDVFLSIARALHAAFGTLVEFHVIGDGPEVAQLRAAEQAGGMPLHVLGFRRDALPLLRGLDMLFLTSDHEGTPMVVLEALALRVLVVARAVGGLPAVLGEGDHGVLIGSTEPAAWVDALRPFMLDPQLRSRLAERGFQAVSTQWSAAANARGYVQLYRECVGGR